MLPEKTAPDISDAVVYEWVGSIARANGIVVYRLLQHIALTGEPRALVLEQDSRLAPAAAAPTKAADVLSRALAQVPFCFCGNTRPCSPALAQVPEDAYIGLWA